MSSDMIQKATAQPAPKAADAKASMQNYIKQMQGEIRKAPPAVITPERFTRIVLSALSTNPKLAETTPQSFLGAMMTAAQLGMEPNTPLGQAYLIPYYNSKSRCNECQFQLGYKKLYKHDGIVWNDDLCLRRDALISFVHQQSGYQDWSANKITRALKDLNALVLQEDGVSTVHLTADSPRVYRIRVSVLKDTAEEY